MSGSEPVYKSWEEWVERDDRDLIVDGVLRFDRERGFCVDGHSLVDLLDPWDGKSVRLTRLIVNGRLVFAITEASR